MPFLTPFALVLAFWGSERLYRWNQRRRVDARRAAAEYPITGNDPTGRTII